jgi:hypothetical protein
MPEPLTSTFLGRVGRQLFSEQWIKPFSHELAIRLDADPSRVEREVRVIAKDRTGKKLPDHWRKPMLEMLEDRA